MLLGTKGKPECLEHIDAEEEYELRSGNSQDQIMQTPGVHGKENLSFNFNFKSIKK